ncbi:MAG: TonB-dependent receptor [Gammaproteobacteria bacterium]
MTILNTGSKRALAVRLLAAIVATAIPAAPVLAQTQGLEEVVVTARKRQVDIQDAAVAVSAVAGEDFDRSNVIRLDNFNGYVPGLTIAKNDGAGRVVAIRGIGWETAQNLSTQPSVLVYMDGIYVANPLSMGTDLGDLERLEVFRGPQGTEFGQGTTGGAINLIMKKPDPKDLAGDLDLAFGTYNSLKARGSLNVPLSENLAVRGSIQRYNRDGFAEIEGGALDGYDLDDADSVTGTASLLWQPADSVSVYLSAFLQDSDQHAAAQKNVDDPNPDERELSQDFPGIFKLQNALYSAIIEWNAPGGLVVKSLTGLQELEKDQSVDGDRLNEALTAIDVLGFFVTTANWDVLTFWDNDSDAFTQELNVSRRGERVDWVLGAYYLDHENFNHFLEATGPSPFSDSIDELANPSVVTLPPFMSVLNFVEARTVTRKDTALYGQSTLRLNDRYALTAGIRYQDEDQTDEALQFFTNQSRQETNDEEFTWKVGLDVDLTEDHLLYGLISTGWKNGGTNPGALAGALQVPLVFEAEELTSFEIGSKNVFSNNRVRFNVVGFYYDYENLQFTQEDPVPFAGGTGNIPETEVYGVETEFNWLLADEWQLDGHLTWLDGEIKTDFFTLDVVDFREALGPGIGLFTPGGFATRVNLSQTTNLKGNEPPKLVDLTARLGLTNNHTLGNGAVFTSRLDYIHRGEYQYRVFNNPLVDTVPSYDIVGLYFRYKPANSGFAFSLSASNVLDKDGVNSRFSNPFALLTTSEEFIPPREIIAAVSYAF